MQQFFAVLSALLCARVIEWVLIASLKTYKEKQEKKLFSRVEAFKQAQQ